jgi:hypothetical protein
VPLLQSRAGKVTLIPNKKSTNKGKQQRQTEMEVEALDLCGGVKFVNVLNIHLSAPQDAKLVVTSC